LRISRTHCRGLLDVRLGIGLVVADRDRQPVVIARRFAGGLGFLPLVIDRVDRVGFPLR
jgi:hypothetical protein